MTRSHRTFFAGIATLALLAAIPGGALAQGGRAATSCPTPKTHSLPKGSTASNPSVFTVGIQGGNRRPWSVAIALDGTVTATGITTSRTQVIDSRNTLKGLLALADAEGFFSMKKSVGCLGIGSNPDVGNRYLMIKTSTGTKRVLGFGSCKATTKYDQLYAIVQQTAGVTQ